MKFGTMFRGALALMTALTLPLACKSEEQPPAQYPVSAQPPAQAGQPPQQPGYGQPAAAPTTVTPTPAPTVAPATGAVTPASGPLSAPGPLAQPCQSDAQCLTHHCNLQFQKCVFPCQNDNDCIAPNKCMAGVCVPSAQ